MADTKEIQQALFDGFAMATTSQTAAPQLPPKSKSKFIVGKLYQIPCNAICTLADQPRKYFNEEDLNALANSIKRDGVLEPLLCTVDESGQLTLVAGERRLRSTTLAGLKSVPVLIVSGDPMEISLIENILRNDLSVVEEAEAMATLKKRKGLKLADLSELTGKSEPTLSEILAVTKLPEQVLQKCRPGLVPRDVLVSISRLKSEEEMIAAFTKFENKTISRQDLKIAAKKFCHSGGTPATNLATSFLKRLEKVDAATLNDADRKAFRIKLGELLEIIKKTIENL